MRNSSRTKTSTSYIFAATALLVSCLAVHGQLVVNPTIGGIPVHCTDATGSIVYVEKLPTMSDVAQSTIEPTGTRVIRIDGPTFAALPNLLKLFIYAHECGHHMSGDVFAGVVLHEDNLNREKTADRIGIRLMRDQLNITAAEAGQIASIFQNNPPIFPYYLPGPQRAKWIKNCYATNSDDCSPAASASYSTHSSSPAPSVDNSGLSSTSFDAAVQKMMEAAGSKFTTVQGPDDGTGSLSSTVTIPYDGKDRSCIINNEVREASCEYFLASESTADDAQAVFDTAQTQLARAAASWTVNKIKPVKASYHEGGISIWEAASAPDGDTLSFPRVRLLMWELKDKSAYVVTITFTDIW
jgi:hypothetical protein